MEVEGQSPDKVLLGEAGTRHRNRVRFHQPQEKQSNYCSINKQIPFPELISDAARAAAGFSKIG